MPASNSPIYLLPGLTPAFPIFNRLVPLLPRVTVVDFIDPLPNESLTEYAARMADQFDPECYIGGISFGGMVALEVARVLQPKGCIMISSVAGPHQLPPWLRVWRNCCVGSFGRRSCSRILHLLGSSAKLVPKTARSVSTVWMTKLAGDDGAWHRGAMSAVLHWGPEMAMVSPLLRIHGTADATFPVRYVRPDVVINSGRHALPISHPVETANAIAAFTSA